MNAKTFERRACERSAVAATAIVLAGNRYAGTCLVENLSATGALLFGSCRLAVHDAVQLLLQLRSGKPVALSARVVRTTPHEQGSAFSVQFQSVPPHFQDRLQRVGMAHLERSRLAESPAVLIVEDCSQTRRALIRQIREAGYRTLGAERVAQAMDHVTAEPDRISAAIVDLHLREASGLDLLAVLADRHPTFRRILISGDTLSGTIAQAVGAGLAHVGLEKPWSPDELVRALAVGA